MPPSLRRRAARVDGAPVTVPLTAGIAVVGGDTLAAAVQRALVLQLCLALPPGRSAHRGPALGQGLDWIEALPHRAARSGGGARGRSVRASSCRRMRMW